jgi:hypothetical protein
MNSTDTTVQLRVEYIHHSQQLLTAVRLINSNNNHYATVLHAQARRWSRCLRLSVQKRLSLVKLSVASLLIY